MCYLLVVLIIVLSECYDNNISILIDFILFFIIILYILYLLFINHYNSINYVSNSNIEFVTIDTDNIQ